MTEKDALTMRIREGGFGMKQITSYGFDMDLESKVSQKMQQNRDVGNRLAAHISVLLFIL